jgi:hypothetical protein
VKFNKSWEEVAKNKPKEMYDAQFKMGIKKNVEDPTAATLSKLDVSKEIYSNPAVLTYLTDRGQIKLVH